MSLCHSIVPWLEEGRKLYYQGIQLLSVLSGSLINKKRIILFYKKVCLYSLFLEYKDKMDKRDKTPETLRNNIFRTMKTVAKIF